LSHAVPSLSGTQVQYQQYAVVSPTCYQ